MLQLRSLEQLASTVSSVTTVEAYRAAQQQAIAQGSGAALEPSGPTPPTPSVAQTVATTDAEATAWAGIVATLMTTAAGVAAVKLIAEKNPAYAKIIAKANETTTSAAQQAAIIQADGAEILAAYPA